MTNIEQKTISVNIFDKKDFQKVLKSAKLEYIEDHIWEYRYETDSHCISFYQDENGKNHIENFAIQIKNVWICLTPTNDQVKLMFDKLNATPYRMPQPIEPFGWARHIDHYTDNGVSPQDFY